MEIIHENASNEPNQNCIDGYPEQPTSIQFQLKADQKYRIWKSNVQIHTTDNETCRYEYRYC